MVRHGCHRQPLPHLPISADGAPACGTKPDIREGRGAYPVSSVPVPCTGGGTFPCVRPDNMSGTDVARYLHAGDEAAHCRRDPGGQRSSLLGRIRTGRMRDVPKAQNLLLSPEDNNGYSQMV